MKRAADLRTEILAVGTELLTPYFQDTNSLFLIERLNDLGIGVAFKTIVTDNREDLVGCFRTAMKRSRLIIAMGGLGPTEDDRTREAAAEALGRKLVFDETVSRSIRERFRRRGVSMSSSNRKQCYVIEGAEVLTNPNGTAPGLWIASGSRRFILLPGPPHELKPMFEKDVWPRLRAIRSGFTLRRVLKITGMPESLMENRIRAVYAKLPPEVNITTLASPGDLQIRLAVSGVGDPASSEAVLGTIEKLLLKKLGENVYSRTGETMEEAVGALLRSRGRTLACAESCTGGFLSHRLTNIPGSSSYFLEGVVSYGNKSKNRRLGVPLSLIREHGAVSGPVAEAMALGVMRRSGSDYGLSITGIAGPDGGTEAKPVGLVFTGLAWRTGLSVEKNLFFGRREIIKFQSSQKALDMLRRRLMEEEI
jgi:nicotinamide-nucleotide amidase